MGFNNFIRKRILRKTKLGTLFLFAAIICFFYMLPQKITKEGLTEKQHKNNEKIDKIIKNNTSRIGPLEKIAKGQKEKVTNLQKHIKKLKKDMDKTANKASNNIQSNN